MFADQLCQLMSTWFSAIRWKKARLEAVALSAPSGVKQYDKGIGTVMSDSICFPGKLAHGHILIEDVPGVGKTTLMRIIADLEQPDRVLIGGEDPEAREALADLKLTGVRRIAMVSGDREPVAIRTFMDRAEALAQFILRAGEAPRFLAFDDVAGCPADTALAALEWTGVVGILLDDDLLGAPRRREHQLVLLRDALEGEKPGGDADEDEDDPDADRHQDRH
mgnify:CR=1 FL=1